MNDRIACAAEEQSSMVKEIDHTMSNINRVAQETVSSIKVVAEEGTELTELADQLNSYVGRFNI